ncbi:unnamed protein product [Calypogeia fissa]
MKSSSERRRAIIARPSTPSTSTNYATTTTTTAKPERTTSSRQIPAATAPSARTPPRSLLPSKLVAALNNTAYWAPPDGSTHIPTHTESSEARHGPEYLTRARAHLALNRTRPQQRGLCQMDPLTYMHTPPK